MDVNLSEAISDDITNTLVLSQSIFSIKDDRFFESHQFKDNVKRGNHLEIIQDNIKIEFGEYSMAFVTRMKSIDADVLPI
jgi:hypothetical protein